MTDIPPDATVVEIDRENGTQVYNQSDIPTEEIFRDGRTVNGGMSLQAALAQWSNNLRPQRRDGGLFERDQYLTPDRIFDQMRLAYKAVEDDDIVSNVADGSEAMAFNSVSFYADEEEEEDVYNQIAADIDLDSRLREMWRELFTVSQFVCATWWHTKTYTVRGKGEGGRKRKKSFTLQVPKAITLIDSMKVIPVGNTMFNQEQLVYAAGTTEHSQFLDLARGQDPIRDRLLISRYTPSVDERKWIGNLGGDISVDRLWIMNSANVFRHTLTRPQFNHFASVRMKSVFEIIDLKQQLRQMDRTHLIGATNFIILITKGSDAHPAKPEEIANLQASVRISARVPVMVGDHRLDVKIVTPSIDNTLKPERYNFLNGSLTARLYHMFVTGNSGGAGAGGDDSLKLAKMIGRGMESRRHMIVRSLEKHVLNEIYDRNEDLESRPKLRFHPANIDLTFNAERATMILDLRDRGEISRDTALSTFELDQDDEARYLEREAEHYDKVFKTINPNNQGVQQPGAGQTPQGGPANQPGPANPAPSAGGDPTAQRRAGQAGKRKGGAAPGSGQGKAPRRPSRSTAEQEEGVEDE